MAIPGHLAMAVSKGTVLIFSFSAFMAATALFTLGLACIKALVVLAYRRAKQHGSTTAVPRTYRLTGYIVFSLSFVWMLSCLPLALGGEASMRYDGFLALTIATITFTELVISVHGIVSSRHHKDSLMEAVKLSSLASAITLLVLTQTALLSMAGEDESVSQINGWFGIGAGMASAGIGIYMLARSRSQQSFGHLPEGKNLQMDRSMVSG